MRTQTQAWENVEKMKKATADQGMSRHNLWCSHTLLMKGLDSVRPPQFSPVKHNSIQFNII